MLPTLISWTKRCPLHCIHSLYATYLHVWLPPHGGQGTRSDSCAPIASHRHMSASVLPLRQWQLFYAVSGNFICLHGVSHSSLGLLLLLNPTSSHCPITGNVFHFIKKWVSSQTKHYGCVGFGFIFSYHLIKVRLDVYLSKGSAQTNAKPLSRSQTHIFGGGHVGKTQQEVSQSVKNSSSAVVLVYKDRS